MTFKISHVQKCKHCRIRDKVGTLCILTEKFPFINIHAEFFRIISEQIQVSVNTESGTVQLLLTEWQRENKWVLHYTLRRRFLYSPYFKLNERLVLVVVYCWSEKVNYSGESVPESWQSLCMYPVITAGLYIFKVHITHT